MQPRAVSDELLTSILRDVSRSFYLTMRMLPDPVRRQISLAYLLARTTDTIADTELVDVSFRLQSLAALRERILGRESAPLSLTRLRDGQGSPAERILLERSEESLRLLHDLEEADRRLVRHVLDIIISGQELDLQRFGAATVQQIVALETEEDLNDYTYRVAGCVGEFWTQICAAHLWKAAELDHESLTRNGVRFGKGLQLVNILRDLPRGFAPGALATWLLGLYLCGRRVWPRLIFFPRKTKPSLPPGLPTNSLPSPRDTWPPDGTTSCRCPKGRFDCGWAAPRRCSLACGLCACCGRKIYLTMAGG